MIEQTTVQIAICPYCEQSITGDALHLMAHGIACRQQWEIRNNNLQNSNNNDSTGNSNGSTK